MRWDARDAERLWRIARDGTTSAFESAKDWSRDAADSTRKFVEDHEAEIDAALELTKQGAKLVAHGVGAVLNGMAALGEAVGDAGGGVTYTDYDG